MNKLIVYIIMCVSFSVIVGAVYTPDTYDNVGIVLEGSYSADTYSNIRLVLDANAANDTCSCPGLNTNWEIDMSDECVIEDNCDLGTGNLNFTGVGNVTCNATINTTNLGDPGLGVYASTSTIDPNIWCYQETANVSTVCGGLSTGDYSYDSSGNIYVNYTKPFNALSNSVWKTAYWDVVTNYSIPTGCWDQQPLQFHMVAVASIIRTTSAECWNGVGWSSIFASSTDGSGYTDAITCASVDRIWDEGWSTGSGWHAPSSCYTFNSYTSPNSKGIWYEEAMWWSLTPPSTLFVNDGCVINVD